MNEFEKEYNNNENLYDSEMTEIGITDILKLGIAFSGKKLKIRTE